MFVVTCPIKLKLNYKTVKQETAIYYPDKLKERNQINKSIDIIPIRKSSICQSLQVK